MTQIRLNSEIKRELKKEKEEGKPEDTSPTRFLINIKSCARMVSLMKQKIRYKLDDERIEHHRIIFRTYDPGSLV